MKEEKENTTSKIDQYMSGIDVEKDFLNTDTGQKYEIGPSLGKGGFAKVYLAKTICPGVENGRRVAIKVVPRRRIAKPEQESKIWNEIALQSTCNHKNIVGLISSWSDSEKICLVLEYCPNRTLSHLMKLSPIRRVPEEASVEIITQVIDALEYLHSHGVVHRDIKLGNILLKRRVAKLADFGLAINFHTTEQKQICGTPNFLPPEVLRHKKHLPQSDIWATGCVLFCLLTGNTPFKYTNMNETARNIVKLKYDIPNYLSKEAVECVKGILQADPNQRWTGTQIQNSCLFKKNIPFKDDSTSFMASVMKLPPPPIVRLPQLKPKDNSKLVKDQTINRV